MGKSPAFQFYPKDFLSDINVARMTYEQKGIYIVLLCHCWLENGIPKEMIEGWFNGGSTTLEPIMKCFYEKDGKYHHKRLDEERIKQQEWHNKSVDGGVKSGESRRIHPVKRGKKKSLKGGSQMVEPNVNQTRTLQSSSSSPFPINKDSRESSCPTPEKLPDEQDVKLTQLLIDLILKNYPDSSTIKKLTPKGKSKWIEQCRLLREKDNKKPEDIEKVIRFSQEDSFWKNNILSMATLRKQWDMLWLKSQKSEEDPFPNGNNPTDNPNFWKPRMA